MIQIHLSKPGGQKEGPYSLEQINRDLAARKYNDTDYWAWYEGLSEWVPLYSVPGVAEASAGSSSGASVDAPRAPTEPAVQTQATTAPAAAASEGDQPPVPARSPVSSDMPFAALEQIFILTTGEGQVVSRAPATVAMLQDIVGEDVSTIRHHVARDVIAHCDVIDRVRSEGNIPDSVWRAMAGYKPDLVQQAREGLYRICVRTFPLDTGELVALFLFYNKQKIQPAAA